MRKLLLSAILAGLCSLLLYAVSFAQSDDYEEVYVEEAIEHIIQIETAYVRARDYLNAQRGTNEDNATSWDELSKLMAELESSEPPTPVASIQQQIAFSAQRCGNYVIPARTATADDLNNIFAKVYITQLQEYCIVQVNEAKLRLLDYAASHDVNLFSRLSVPVVLTYTTPITATSVVTSESTLVNEQYVILEDETDSRLTPVIVEGLRSEDGDFVLHLELAPSEEISEAGVNLTCFGPQQKVLCSRSAALQLHPGGNLVTYTETDVPFEDVEWFRIYWQGRD